MEINMKDEDLMNIVEEVFEEMEIENIIEENYRTKVNVIWWQH